jgi:hypothetical protein
MTPRKASRRQDISDLKSRLARAEERLAKLAEKRRPHALGAATGDAKAKRAIEKLDADAAAARGDIETLGLLDGEEAEKREAEHDAQVAAEDRRRREAEVQRARREHPVAFNAYQAA